MNRRTPTRAILSRAVLSLDGAALHGDLRLDDLVELGLCLRQFDVVAWAVGGIVVVGILTFAIR